MRSILKRRARPDEQRPPPARHAAPSAQQGPLRQIYLDFLASQAGLDLALADTPPSVPPNPFSSGSIDVKATQAYLRWLDQGKRYENWATVGSEPQADFLYRLATVRKRAPYLGRVAALQEVLDRDAAGLLEALADSGRELPFPIYIGVYPTGDYNAHVEAVEGGALVLINAGLMDLLFTVLKVNLAASGGGRNPPLITHEQTAMVLAEAFNAYLYGEGSLSAWGLPPIGEQRLSTFEFLLRAGELFVIAHELGHLVLGHVRLPEGEGRAEVELSTANELAADAFAFEVLVSGAAFATTDSNAPFLAGGMMNVLALATVVEKLQKCLALEAPDDTTHPELGERWAQLGGALELRFPQAHPLEGAEKFLGWLMVNELPGIVHWLRLVNETMRRPGKYE